MDGNLFWDDSGRYACLWEGRASSLCTRRNWSLTGSLASLFCPACMWKNSMDVTNARGFKCHFNWRRIHFKRRRWVMWIVALRGRVLMAANGTEIGHIMPRQSLSGESSFNLIPLTPINTSRAVQELVEGGMLSFRLIIRIEFDCIDKRGNPSNVSYFCPWIHPEKQSIDVQKESKKQRCRQYWISFPISIKCLFGTVFFALGL